MCADPNSNPSLPIPQNVPTHRKSQTARQAVMPRSSIQGDPPHQRHHVVSRLREALAPKAALLVVTAALACVLVVSINRWNAGGPATTMWRSGSSGSDDSIISSDSGSSSSWEWSSPPPPPPITLGPGGPAKDSDADPACRFDYPGPLRPESYDCYTDFFPLSLPFSYPEMATVLGRSFSLSGVTWEDASVPRIPIFILFKDRVSVLMETLRSYYRFLGTPYEVRRTRLYA